MTNVPGIGNVDQKWLYAGGALVVGIVGYAYFRRSQAPAVVPGVDTFPDAGTGGAPGYQNPAPAGTITPGGVGTAPTTDLEWSARVTEVLGNLGYDVAALSRVLGKYLTRTPLSPEEASWIQTAWAYVGRPPGGAYPITPTPVPTTPPPAPAPAAWKPPLVRKAPGGPLVSIKTPAGGRRTWAQLLPIFYNNVPPASSPAHGRAVRALKAANVWRARSDGSGFWDTAGPLVTVSVPSTIY